MAQVKLSLDSVGEKIVNCTRVTYQFSAEQGRTPIPGLFSIVEVQQQGWANPAFTLVIEFPDEPSSYYSANSFLSWEDFYLMATNKYEGTSDTQLTLSITAGENNDQVFSSYAASSLGTSSIPVTIKTFTVNFNPDTDSLKGGHWTVNATLWETA